MAQLNLFVLMVAIFSLQINIISATIIKGVVTDGTTNKPISNVNIHLQSADKGTISNIYGQFIMAAVAGDSIKFSAVGYEPQYRVVQHTDTLNIRLIPKSYYLKAVDILGTDRLPPECQSDIFSGGNPGIFGLVNPVSYIYYLFNRGERAKRRFQKRFEYNRKMARVMSIYNRNMIIEFTGYSGSKLDSCIVFCNSNIELHEKDTEFIIKHKLLDVLSTYERLKKEPDNR